MVNQKVGLVPMRDCITQIEGNFVDIIRRTGVCGVDGSGGKNSSFPRSRSVGAGCGTAILRGHHEADDSVQEEAWMASKVPGRQTVPRAEIWAVLMVLLVWYGTFDLTIITDASYTGQGMDDLARRKNSRGPNRDIWQLIYAELDAKAGGGLLTITKVKSHIDGVQAYCRDTPFGHIIVNEIADFAADRYCDHAGDGKADKAKFYSSKDLMERVCKRIAVIESTLREYATDLPQVAAGVISACDAAGETRRQQIKDRKDSRIERFTSKYGHNVVFVPYVRPATCKKCPAATAKGLPPPDACMRCGPGRWQYRCSICLKRSQGCTKGFLATGCSRNDPLAPAPDRRGTGTYSNLRAHLAADSGDEDPADFDFVTST